MAHHLWFHVEPASTRGNFGSTGAKVDQEALRASYGLIAVNRPHRAGQRSWSIAASVFAAAAPSRTAPMVKRPAAISASHH